MRDTNAVIPALTDEQVEAALAAGAVLDDARDQQEFAAGHVKGSVNVPWDGRMAETVGTVFTPDQQIVIIAPEGQEQQVATRFARIGFDNVLGYVPDPHAYLLAHQKSVQRASRLTVAQVEDAIESTHAQIVDIRNAGELEAGMLAGRAAHPARRTRPSRRRARPDPPGPALLRGRVAQQRRRQPAAGVGIPRRLGHPGRLRRLGACSPAGVLTPHPRNRTGPAQVRPFRFSWRLPRRAPSPESVAAHVPGWGKTLAARERAGGPVASPSGSFTKASQSRWSALHVTVVDSVSEGTTATDSDRTGSR